MSFLVFFSRQACKALCLEKVRKSLPVTIVWRGSIYQFKFGGFETYYLDTDKIIKLISYFSNLKLWSCLLL